PIVLGCLGRPFTRISLAARLADRFCTTASSSLAITRERGSAPDPEVPFRACLRWPGEPVIFRRVQRSCMIQRHAISDRTERLLLPLFLLRRAPTRFPPAKSTRQPQQSLA